MKRFKGTPGPWFLDQYGNLKAEQGDCALSMVGFSGLCLTIGRTAKANTQLVAAAPKLLDAAIMAIEHYDAYFGGSAPDDLPWVPVMREAIKEALGEDME